MSTADISAVALGVNGLASTGALVYVVRRVSPWPKPPALPQPSGSGSARKSGTNAGLPGNGQASAANGSDPARSTV
jgi:hypothetical protein